MTPLLLAVLLTALLLLVLWALLDRALWLALRLFDPLVERSRRALETDRLLRQIAATAQRQSLRPTPRQRVVDLDGQRRWLLPEQLQAFQRRCWAELELPAGTPWPQVRQQWRRRSLAWHPDRGGDPAQWLRKQRAYDGLRNISASGVTRSATPPPRIAIGAARGRWFRRRRGG